MGIRNPKLPWLVCVALLLTSGCVRRSLTIRTDPVGAMVYVNDQLKGQSPVTYDFMWYGWHRIMVRKEGFQRVDDRKLLRAPVYLWIPLDLVMELLPWPVRDRREWSYTLTPLPEQPTPQPPLSVLPDTEPASAAASMDAGSAPISASSGLGEGAIAEAAAATSAPEALAPEESSTPASTGGWPDAPR